MDKALRIFSSVLYIFALSLLTLYFVFDLKTYMLPHIRLILLTLICLSAYFASFIFAKTLLEENAKRLMKGTFFAFFALYILLLVTLVLFDSYFGRVGVTNIPKWSREAFGKYFDSSVNILPFKTISEFITGAFAKNVSVKSLITNIFGNLAAFAPFAFFLPTLFDKLRSFKSFLAAMIIIVLSAEMLQMLLLTGACDIDDLILNVLGASVAFGLFKIKYVEKIIKTITFT